MPETQDILRECEQSIGEKRCNPLGTPREKSIGGAAMALLAKRVMEHGWQEPWYAISEAHRVALEKELGRCILASGDTLFGRILVMPVDTDEEIASYVAETGRVVIDCRGDFA
jgi:hypothetical protein